MGEPIGAKILNKNTMEKQNCPICNNPIEPQDRLVLEYINHMGHWTMLHLKPSVKGQYEHSRYPGFMMWCGQSACWQPEMINNIKR